MIRRQHLAPRRGLALILVMVYSVLILSAWAMANRQTVDLVTIKGRLAEREADGGAREVRSRRLALAYGLALLETGVPSRSPYQCGTRVTLPDGGWQDYVMTFVKATSSQWQLTVTPGDITGLDRPLRFGPPSSSGGSP